MFSGTQPIDAHGHDNSLAFMDQPTCNHGPYCLVDHLVFRVFWSLPFVHVDTNLCVLDHLKSVIVTNSPYLFLTCVF